MKPIIEFLEKPFGDHLRLFFDSANFDVQTWKVLLVGAFLFFRIGSIIRFIIYKCKQRGNAKIAKQILHERNSKAYKFEDVDEKVVQLVKEATCSKLRELLHAEKVTSLQLVHFYGFRCYTKGRNLKLSAEEMFDSAI